MAVKWTFQLLLLAVVAASVASGVAAARAPSRMLAKAAKVQPCKNKFGPWPPTVPKGSTAWQDGQHANLTTFIISITDTTVKGIKTEYVDFPTGDRTKPTFVTFSHGTVTGRRKTLFEWPVTRSDNVPFTQVNGSYNARYGLVTLNFFDSNNNEQLWGDRYHPGPFEFSSPFNRGHIVGLFGASNKTHLTQIGVCLSE